jgi:arylsulfatase A-like enzyme
MKKKSIVLVTVDCMRADHVGFMGYNRPVTPFLDTLASESFVFPTAVVAGAPTFYSFPAILASRYPLALGRDIVGLIPDEPTLASVLRHAGYATAAFASANPYISSRFGYQQGFDTFRDYQEEASLPTVNTVGAGWASQLNRTLQKIRPSLGPLGIAYDEFYFRYCQRVSPLPASVEALRRYPAADVIVDDACGWLATHRDEPFFLWLHLMDPHSPYYPKQEALALMGDPPVTPRRARYMNDSWNRSNLGPRRFGHYRDEIVRLYDAGIRWVDAQMARLIDDLQGADVWKDCIFVLTGDHGEEFLDHGGRYHPPSRLMEELIRVPLLMRVPGAAKNVLSESPFSLLHLAPTLLDCAGLSAPAGFEGSSYWPQLQRDGRFDAVAISECVEGCHNPFRAENRMRSRVLAVREARYKLVLHFERSAEYLYDLVADPGEQAPLAPQAQTMMRRRLLEIAREHLQKSSRQRDGKMRVQARLNNLRLEWKNPASKASAVAS